jgi:hypothetical protein
VRNRSLPRLIALALLGFAGTASAEISSPTLLYGTPTTDVLPVGTLAVSADVSLARTSTSWGREENANVRFSPYKHLDLAVTAYTVADYVLDVKYQFIGDGPGRFGLAAGVYDLGLSSYISPVGRGAAGVWPDWKYEENDVTVRPYENFSAFAVGSYRPTRSIRLHAGLGRGRFVGYGDRSKYLNTDVFFNHAHQWALGLFAGAEVYVIPQVALVVEASGRDVNGGLKADLGPITATVACNKVEGLLFASGDHRYGRLEVGFAYRFSDWASLAGLFRPRGPRLELAEHVCPPPEPVPTPRGVTACPSTSSLEPIWFDWDSWEITPGAAASLARNADTLLDHLQTKVVLIGYASEGGSLEANCMLSGKRALAVFEYLKSLGVPEQQMRIRSVALPNSKSHPAYREVCFDTEPNE